MTHTTTYDSTPFSAVASCTCGWAQLYTAAGSAAKAGLAHENRFNPQPVQS